MPLQQKSQEELQHGVDSMEPHFATLLEEKGVSFHIRGLLGQVGLRRSQTLAGIGSTEELARNRLEQFLNISDADGLETMIQVSNLLEAWRAARARSAAQEEAQAEAAASGRLRDIPHLENLGMREVHEKVFGEVDDAEYPSRDYLGWRISQFETGHFAAETLDQVVSYERAADDKQDPNLALQFTPGSSKVTAVRRSASAPIPKSTEELRAAYEIMKRHWEVVKLRYPDRAIFRKYCSTVWDDLIRHLLSNKVYMYRSRKGYGIAWEDLLDYEYNIRKWALRLVRKNNQPLMEALREARDCPKLEQKFFTLQLCTTGHKYSENAGRKTDTGASSSANRNDDDERRKRSIEEELKQVKRLRQQLQKGSNKGNKGWTANTQNTKGSKTSKGGKGGSDADDGLRSRWNDVKRREILQMKLPGSNKSICMFYQYHSCHHGRDQCGFAHVCARCHKAGHAAIDAECQATPRMK